MILRVIFFLRNEIPNISISFNHGTRSRSLSSKVSAARYGDVSELFFCVMIIYTFMGSIA